MKRTTTKNRLSGKVTFSFTLSAALLIAASVAVLLVPSGAAANPFILFGPRGQGMGGAQVGVADDYSALYWNPASLALEPGWEVALPLIGARAEEHNDVIETGIALAEMIDDGTYLTSPLEFLRLVDQYDKHGSGVAADLQVGLAMKGRVSRDERINFALSIFDNVYIGSDPKARFPYIIPSNIELSAYALESRELAFSFAYQLINVPGEEERRKYFLSAGINLKYIWGVTYYMHRDILGVVEDELLDKDAMDFVSELIGENSKSTHNIGVDVGLTFEYDELFRIGIVGRNLNNPKFDYQEGGDKVGELELDPQVRVGLAFIPIENIIIAADVDLTKNSSGIVGFDDQRWSLGAEFSLLDQLLSLRVGITDNFAESVAEPMFTGGFGFRVWKLHFDLSGGINTDLDEASAGFLLSGQF